MPSARTGESLGEQRLALAKSIIKADAAAVAGLAEQLDESFLTAAELVISCRGNVLVCGMGTSGASARRIAHLLAVGGTSAFFVDAADGLHGGLGAVSHGDVVIAISKGGESDELNEFAQRARARGATIIAITAARHSTLAASAQCPLVIQTAGDADFGGLVAMGSALAHCAIGDALAGLAMEARDGSWATFEQSHPAGAVGKHFEDVNG